MNFWIFVMILASLIAGSMIYGKRSLHGKKLTRKEWAKEYFRFCARGMIPTSKEHQEAARYYATKFYGKRRVERLENFMEHPFGSGRLRGMLKKKRLERRGIMRGESAAFAWIVVLLFVFLITFLWIILSMIYVPYVFPFAEQSLAGYSDATDMLTTLKNAWNYWPLLLLFGMGIYGIVSSIKRDPEQGWY